MGKLVEFTDSETALQVIPILEALLDRTEREDSVDQHVRLIVTRSSEHNLKLVVNKFEA